MHFQIQNCTQKQLLIVKRHIAQFELDDHDLNPAQFMVALKNNTVLGFGRVREYDTCAEMASLGVMEGQRNKGIGKALVKTLMNKTKKPLYLVSVIPDYFSNLGFVICNTYPAVIKNKLNFCITKLYVQEPYVVMRKD